MQFTYNNKDDITGVNSTDTKNTTNKIKKNK
jgi:hypothetical protein